MAYVIPIVAFVVLLVMILRDSERYKKEHPASQRGSWLGSNENPWDH